MKECRDRIYYLAKILEGYFYFKNESTIIDDEKCLDVLLRLLFHNDM